VLNLEAWGFSQPDPLEGSAMHPRRRRLQRKLAKLLDVRGAAAVEYGLMMALIAVVIIAAVIGVGSRLSAIFDTVASSL